MSREKLRHRLGRLWENVREEVPLAGLTTLGVGGPARYLAECSTVAELQALLVAARDLEISTFVLGGGSNLLVSDRGFEGIVLRYLGKSLVWQDEGSHPRLRIAAGLEWDDLVARTVQEGLAGLECLSGIPGRVGAAPMQNIGAYGQEVAETIESVRVVDRGTGEVRDLSAEECSFAYRKSRFKQAWRDRFVVVEVSFRLRRGPACAPRYPDLRRRLGIVPENGGPAPPLAELRRAVLEIRRSKSMLYDPEDPNHRSAGSFFLNPMVSRERAETIREQLAGEGNMPLYPGEDGKVKLSAAWLIERSGFRRGDGEGRAGLSTRHVLALVNRGGATAAELVAYAAKVRQGVRRATGILLSPEPVFWGFGAPGYAVLDQVTEGRIASAGSTIK